jgi:hypothetical protein
MCRRPYLIKFNRTLADGTAECACYFVLGADGTAECACYLVLGVVETSSIRSVPLPAGKPVF